MLATHNATQQKPFYGTARGKRLSFDLLMSLRFEQDGIAHERTFHDFSGTMLKTGAIKAKPI